VGSTRKGNFLDSLSAALRTLNKRRAIAGTNKEKRGVVVEWRSSCVIEISGAGRAGDARRVGHYFRPWSENRPVTTCAVAFPPSLCCGVVDSLKIAQSMAPKTQTKIQVLLSFLCQLIYFIYRCQQELLTQQMMMSRSPR
jgi:hypothetical protein